jgi:hypothetical protein
MARRRKYWKPGRRPIVRVKTDPYEWRVWMIMRQRYPTQVCDRWLDCFADFVQDMGGYGTRPRHTFLSRRDKTGPFSPDNCYWKPRVKRKS